MSMFVIMGAPGMGKSPFCQKMIENRQCLVFDVNNEYGTRTKYPGARVIGLSTDVKQPRSRYVGTDLAIFTRLALSKRNTVVIFEEATMFFRGKQKSETSKLLIGRLHTGNTYLFLFHSINRVPPEIMEIADIAVLFKTNDEEKTILRKYPRMYQPYLKLRNSKDGEKVIIKMLEL